MQKASRYGTDNERPIKKGSANALLGSLKPAFESTQDVYSVPTVGRP